MNLVDNLTVQNMVLNVLTQAKEKVAAEEKKVSKNPFKPAAKKTEECHEEKTAFLTKRAFVEQLADATDHISENFSDLLPKGVLARAKDKLAEKSPLGPGNGPGKGPGTPFSVTGARGGSQENKEHAKPVTKDPSVSTANTSLHGGRGEHVGHNAVADTLGHKPGDDSYGPNGPDIRNLKKQAARQLVLSKFAGEDVAKASILAARAAGGEPGKGNTALTVWDSGDAGPSRPSTGHGNEKRDLIASNSAARNYGKKDAKKGPTTSFSEKLWDEPAFNPKTDTTVDRVFDKGTDQFKFASQLVKQGCVCGGRGGCGYCGVKSKFQYALHKLANEGMVPQPDAAAGGPPPEGGPPPPGMPGAMPPRPEGCTCGGQPPLCNVCKYMAMMQMMKMQQAQPGAQGAPGMQGAMPPGAGPQPTPGQGM